MQTAKLITANQAAILKACANRPLSYNAIAKHVPELAKPKRCVDDMTKAKLLWGVGDGEFGATDSGKQKLADYIKANEKPQEAATAPETKKAFKPASMGTKAAPKAATAPEAASKPETLSAKLAKLPKTTGSRKADAKAAAETAKPKAAPKAAKAKKAPIEKAAGLRTNTDVPERSKREIELGLSPRQAQAINFVRGKGGATVKEINALFGTVSSRLHVLQEGCTKAGLKLASKKEGTKVIWYIEK